jgi:hypothetical protein
VNIIWTQHAMGRFIERALLYGLSRSDFEIKIKKQEVRIDCGVEPKYKKRKFETICEIANKFFTIEKAEDTKIIIVITLWESNKEEVDLWFSKQK